MLILNLQIKNFRSKSNTKKTEKTPDVFTPIKNHWTARKKSTQVSEIELNSHKVRNYVGEGLNVLFCYQGKIFHIMNNEGAWDFEWIELSSENFNFKNFNLLRLKL